MFNGCQGSFPALKPPKLAFKHPPPSSGECKNDWGYICTPRNAFVAQTAVRMLIPVLSYVSQFVKRCNCVVSCALKVRGLSSSILGAFTKLRKASISFVMSVHLSAYPSGWYNSAPSRRIFMKFDIWVYFEYLSWKFKFRKNPASITGTLHEDICVFMASRWIVKTRSVSDNTCRANQNTHFICNNPFPKLVSFMK